MILVTDADELNEIVELANKYLNRHQPRDYELKVEREAVQRDDDCYFVVVKPSRNDVPSYDYTARLAEAEQELEDGENRKVLFVPAIPN